jgi:hypothetical protein
MMPKNSGMHSLETPMPMRDPSTPFVREAPGSIGGAGRVCGVGGMNTDASYAPSEAVSRRAAGEPSSPHGGAPEEDPEYEEVDDLIYERTGTLSFPYTLRIVEGGIRTEAVGARPEATEAPSAGSELSAWSSLGRLVRDLRDASAGTPGVSMLATVDVIGGERASTARQPEPSKPPSVAEVKAPSPSSTSIPRAVVVSPSLPQRVAVGPTFAPPRRTSVVADRAIGKVAQTFVASPSPPASRHVEPSRGREARSFAPVANAKRTTQPSLRVKQRAGRVYPSFGQRVLAEVRRSPLAKRRTASGVVAAAVVAAVVIASSTLGPRHVPRETVASRSSVAAVVDGRAPVPGRLPEKVVASRGSVATVGDERAPLPALAHVEPRVSVAPDGDEYNEVTLAPPAADEELTGDRSKGAEAKARSNRRAPTHSRRHEPCDCLPGDPLCGCLD